jgi:predicted nuclease of restriction endonuclease-like (RecB) superfamily
VENQHVSTAEYQQFVAELKARVLSARVSAARAVNRDLILLYWDIGRAILERQERLGWGQAVIERLSEDLRRAFPSITGFSARNLRNMRQFYEAYSGGAIWQQAVAKLNRRGGAALHGPPLSVGGFKEVPEFLQQIIAEIPWGHHILILNKVEDAGQRLYYLRATAQFGWTRNVLLNQIKAGAYERSLPEGKTHNFPAALPDHLAEQAEEALKSSYNLEFLGISREIKERELEERLIEDLQRFILELGYGFCFIGRQYRLTLGSKEYFIDLLFYHRFLKALVGIDLKVGPFAPEYAGKMDFYLNLLNEKERAPDDNPSIGIILCAEKDNLEVEFALKSKTNPIGVAEYQLRTKLPKELKGKLPTPTQLRTALRLSAKEE